MSKITNLRQKYCKGSDFFRAPRRPAFGAPPAGGCPRRMAGCWSELVGAPPRGEAAGRGVPIDFQMFTSGHPPGALARAAAGPRPSFRATERAHAGRSSRVAASIKCRISRSYFCREQSRQSEGIAVAMARVGNAVIGKKNETWCDDFMLAATLRRRRVLRSYLACIRRFL